MSTAAALREWVSRLGGTLLRRRRDAELEAELRAHLEIAADEARASGRLAVPAGRAVALRAGGLSQAMEAMRDQRGLPWLDHLLRDLRHAARGLRRAPAFTAAAVLSLALGIGATTAIFTVVQTVVLNPLPYQDSDRIIRLDHRVPRVNAPALPATPLGLAYLYGDRARTLSTIAVYRQDAVTLTGGGGDDAERVPVTRATPALAAVLGVRPVRGRWFNDAEGAPGGAPAAVLSHGLWVRRYAADPAIIGQSVTISGVPTTVVGIMPASFTFDDPRTQLWLAEPITRASGFGIFVYTAVARMRDGVSVSDVRVDLNLVIKDLANVFPQSGLAVSLSQEGFASLAITLKEAMLGNVAGSLWMLLAAVGVLLVVAFVNVANLVLVRAEMRQREVAVRRSLGAGRLGILRGFGAEALWLAIAGAAGGVLLARMVVAGLLWLGPSSVPRLGEIHISGGAVMFAAALGVVAAVLLTVTPMLHGTSVMDGLHEAGRGQVGGHRHYARRLLMGAQIALALVLVAVSGLMLRTFQALGTVDPGFDARSALTFRVGLPERQYDTREKANAAHRALLERLGTLPGGTAVSMGSCLPLTITQGVGNCLGNTLFVERNMELDRPRGLPAVTIHAVGPAYFDTLRIPLLRGRTLTAGEIERGEPNVLIDQALVDAYFPGADPIGQRVASSRPPIQGPPMRLTIIGIVGNTSTVSLTETKPTPKLYMPMSIAGGPDIPRDALVGPNIAAMSYVLRTSVPPLQLLAAARARIKAFDPSVALSDVRTLEGRVADASARTTFTMLLLAAAAGLTLILGVIGTYGVMSYIVSQRRAEIGVRLAFGAEPRTVARMIVRQGGVVAVLGVMAGLAVSLAGGRFIESLLFGVQPHDSMVLAAAALALISISLMACWLPARRAARLNPTVALRDE